MSLRDQFVSIMNEEGASSEGGWHSWRCFDKGRYPEPCLCTETVAKKLVAAALRDAVEAVDGDLNARISREADEGDLDGLMDGLVYGRDKAVAAIKALGGEQ